MDQVINKNSKGYSTIPRYSLKLIKEKGIRYPLDKVIDSSLAETVIRAYLENLDCEHLVSLMLDGQNNVLGLHLITIGGINSCGASIRDVFKAAIVGRASAIVLGHSHPSGDVRPSNVDIVFTNKVKEAGEMLGIPLIDHIIVSGSFNEGSWSFRNHGLL